MNIQSLRLIYRKFENTDFGAYEKFAKNEAVMRYITGQILTDEQAIKKFADIIQINETQPDFGFAFTIRKEDNAIIGYLKFAKFDENQAEIGYCLLPEFWGNNYASEIVNAMINFAKTLPDITELIAIVEPANGASKKVLAKNNFKLYKEDFKQRTPIEYHKLEL